MEGVDFNAYKYMQMVSDAREEVAQERQRLIEMSKRVELLDQCLNAVQEQSDINSELQEKLGKRQEEVERLKKQLDEKTTQLKGTIAELKKISKQNAELDVRLKEQNAMLEITSRQLSEEKRQRADLEMNLAETRKLMDSIAKKSSEEGVQKAIQTFVNYSKRKTSDKRTYIKNTLLEFTSVNRIFLPEELSATIDCLDDEQPETKNVTVNGGIYNDIHDNKEVDL